MPQASRAFSLQDLSVHSPLYKAGGDSRACRSGAQLPRRVAVRLDEAALMSACWSFVVAGV